jgi:hypothetical protein
MPGMPGFMCDRPKLPKPGLLDRWLASFSR